MRTKIFNSIKMRYKQYSVVRLTEIRKQFDEKEVSFFKRSPVIGDEATILEIYEKPTLGYELECTGDNGVTEWMIAFSADEVDFELLD